MSVRIVSARNLRAHLASVLDDIKKKFDRYLISRRGRAEYILMSLDDYEGMVETLEIQSDKKLMREIRRAEKEFEKGKGKGLDELRKELGIV